MRSTSRSSMPARRRRRLSVQLRRRAVEARDVVARHRGEVLAQLVGDRAGRSDRRRAAAPMRERAGPGADLDDARARTDVAPEQDRTDVLRVDQLRLARQVRDELGVGRPQAPGGARPSAVATLDALRDGRSASSQGIGAPRTLMRPPAPERAEVLRAPCGRCSTTASPSRSVPRSLRRRRRRARSRRRSGGAARARLRLDLARRAAEGAQRRRTPACRSARRSAGGRWSSARAAKAGCAGAQELRHEGELACPGSRPRGG